MQVGHIVHLITRILAAALLCVLFLQPAAAEDVWEGVFAYQKKMAEYGHPEAQVKLGEMYEEGHGTAQNFERAQHWYQKAASQGYAKGKQKLKLLDARRKRAAGERKRAEQARIEQEQAEQERLAREQARQERIAQQRRARTAKQSSQKQQAERKARSEEEEALARKRAREAMEKMMARPDAYSEE